MDFKICCGTWIKEDDEKVLTVLRESDRWLSVEELSEMTGLPAQKVTHTLKMLKKQVGISEGREILFKE